MIYPEAKFLSSCESMKTGTCASKMQWWDRHKTGISIALRNKKGDREFQIAQNLSGQILLDFKF
jgi:hypothetical protein